MSTFIIFILFICIVSSDHESIHKKTTLFVDVNVNSFIEAFNDLTLLYQRKLSGFSSEHYLDGAGLSLYEYHFFLHSINSVKLIRHHEHFHLVIDELKGAFNGIVEVRPILYKREFPWRRVIHTKGIIGPIKIMEIDGWPYIDPALRCNIQDIGNQKKSEINENAEMDEIIGRIVSKRMKLIGKTEDLTCSLIIEVLDSIIREKLLSLKMTMRLPTDDILSYSVISRPTWPLSSVSFDNVSSNLHHPLLRFHLHSQIHHHLHQRDLPQKGLLHYQKGSLHPFHPHFQMGNSLHFLLPQMDDFPLHSIQMDLHPVHSLPPSDYPVLQPFDIVYHIYEDLFNQTIESLCKSGRFDRMFTVPRGDFNLSLSIQCDQNARVDLSSLPESWKMNLFLPLLYTYTNGTNTMNRLIEKKMILSIHVDQLRLSFIVQSAFPQPNELGRFVFSNQVFRHLSSTISNYFIIHLPFIDSSISSIPSVTVYPNRLVLATNLTRIF